VTLRRVLVTIAIVVSVVGVLLILNLAGILRYPGGPLREPNADGILWLDTRPPDQGNIEVGMTPAAGAQPGVAMYTSTLLRNEWPWAAAVERVRLVGATPGLRLVDVRIALPDAPAGAAGGLIATDAAAAELGLETQYGPLPADLAPTSADGPSRVVSLEVVADQPGRQSFDAVGIDYRVGPFTFSVTSHLAFYACVYPSPAGCGATSS
jgi:hypothetical protein